MNTTLVAGILSASVPTLAIVLSILLSRSDFHKLDAKIDAKIDAVRANSTPTCFASMNSSANTPSASLASEPECRPAKFSPRL